MLENSFAHWYYPLYAVQLLLRRRRRSREFHFIGSGADREEAGVPDSVSRVLPLTVHSPVPSSVSDPLTPPPQEVTDQTVCSVEANDARDLRELVRVPTVPWGRMTMSLAAYAVEAFHTRP